MASRIDSPDTAGSACFSQDRWCLVIDALDTSSMMGVGDGVGDVGYESDLCVPLWGVT